MNDTRLSRRAFLAAAATLPALRVYGADSPTTTAPQQGLAGIERRLGGRIGVSALDSGSGRRFDYRGGELFPMCSTFKLMLVACVLSRVDAGQEQLERVLSYGEADLLEYAPAAREHLKQGGMSIAALCGAAVSLSDNTAANLLLATIGGPAGLTRYCRGLGDKVTRLDRTEPELNSAIVGDPRDTTTPAAMLKDLQAVLLGPWLSSASRQQLTGWLVANQTGDRRLRAGLPSGWRAGDKTGTGRNGAVNDIAILWPPGREPVLVTAYTVESPASSAEHEAALADIGRLVAAYF
jgi:beta-lactamase class A